MIEKSPLGEQEPYKMTLTNRQFAATWELLKADHQITNEQIGIPNPDLLPVVWWSQGGNATEKQWRLLLSLAKDLGYQTPTLQATQAPNQTVALSPLFAYLRKCGSSQMELAKALDMHQPNLSKLRSPTKLKRELIEKIFLEAKYLIAPRHEEGLRKVIEDCYNLKSVAVVRGAPKMQERVNLNLVTDLLKKHGLTRGKLARQMEVCPTRLGHHFKSSRMTPFMVEKMLEALHDLLPPAGRRELRKMEERL